MASFLCRNALQIVRRTSLVVSTRASSAPSIDPQKGKVVSDKVSMPDTLGHSVGPERFELLARSAGNEDPFELNVKPRASGSKVDPTIIPSMFDKRLVGCICEEDAITINWMWLHEGEPKRCACGNWFKLVELEHVDYGQ